MCCQQFLHFKHSSGHRFLPQSLISSSDQTGADTRPLQMSPKSPVIDVTVNFRKDEYHAPSLTSKHMISSTRATFCPCTNTITSERDSSSPITAAGSLQQQIKSSHSCGRVACVVQAQREKRERRQVPSGPGVVILYVMKRNITKQNHAEYISRIFCLERNVKSVLLFS